MDAALLIARLILAGVFAVAAAGKLMDLAGSRQAVAGFGVPRRLADLLGTALPFAELAVAVALLFAPTARAGALGALVLLRWDGPRRRDASRGASQGSGQRPGFAPVRTRAPVRRDRRGFDVNVPCECSPGVSGTKQCSVDGTTTVCVCSGG